jgi:hypothetical protein
MPLASLSRLEDAIRSSWSAETCDPVDRAVWSRENPSRGQCAVTALVVHDLLGGELLMAEVLHADGTRQGVHYWNRLAGGMELDLTREQFLPGEVVQAPEVVAPPADVDGARLEHEYKTLAARVDAALAADEFPRSRPSRLP